MAEPAASATRSARAWLLAAEALWRLAWAAASRRRSTFARLTRPVASGGSPRSGGLAAPATPGAVAWAIDAADRRGPWSFTCLERGLAAQAMLRRRGVASTLCYGGRSDGSLGPSAHVWVRVGELDVLGGEEAARFAMLAAFPAAPPTGL